MNGAPDPHPAGKTTVPVAPPTSVRWQIVGLLVAYSFMTWFNRVSMSVAGSERIIKDYEISKTQIGWVYTALLLTYTLCMTPGGWFIDRLGARTALVIVGFTTAAFAALTGAVGLVFAAPLWLWLGLLAARGLMGIGMAPVYPGCSRLAASWLPLSQRAAGNGLITAAAPVGIASTYWGFGALIDGFGWPAAFLITGAVAGLLALVWTVYGTDRPEQHPSVNEAERRLILGPGGVYFAPSPSASSNPRRAGWAAFFRNRSLMLLTLSYAAVGYVEYLFFFWVEHYFEDELKLGKDLSRTYSSLVTLGMAVGMVLGGRMSDSLLRSLGHRRGRVLVPPAGLLAGAVLVLVGSRLSVPLAVTGCFALAVAAVGATEGPCWATAVELGGRRGGTSAGIFNTGGNLLGLIAPVITPWVAEGLGFGWSAAVALGSIVSLAGAVPWLWIDPTEKASDDEADSL